MQIVVKGLPGSHSLSLIKSIPANIGGVAAGTGLAPKRLFKNGLMLRS
jgi:hypothetical protein